MIQVAEASGTPDNTLEKLRTRSESHWVQLFNLMDTSGDGDLQWAEVWKEMEGKKNQLHNSDWKMKQ